MSTTRRRKTRRTRPENPADSPVAGEEAPVRLTRVRTVLQRIASGYYDRDDVRDRLAAAVLRELRRR